MTNPTSNFGWQMPTPTDLVTDLPADFEVFGQAVDTSLADLQGGTTGQILAKATNADMDFAWITNDVGDITAVNVTSPITGGGSSGAVTIGINAATTSVVGAVQLSDSTSTTSSVLASTPTATKSAYDLADAAIAKSVVTTAGDIIYRDGSAPVRLGIGTAGQVLAVNSGATAPEWKTPAGGGKVLQVVSATYSTELSMTSTTYADTGLSLSITPTSATSKVMVIISQQVGTRISSGNEASTKARLLRAGTDIFASNYAAAIYVNSGLNVLNLHMPIMFLDSPATTSATIYKTQIATVGSTSFAYAQYGNSTSTITLFEIGA